MQRRVAVAPVIVAVVALLVFAVVVTIVITLAAATTPGSGAQAPTPGVSPSAVSPDLTVPDSAAVAPTEESTGARCVDFTEETVALDIVEASLTQTDRGDLTVDVTLASAVPAGSAQLGIYVERSDADRAYQFSVEINDREIESVTSYEFDDKKSDRLDVDDAEIDGAVVSFVIPRNVFKKLGDDWSWFAFSMWDDASADACPGDPGSFETLLFDSTASSSPDSEQRD